MTYKIVVCIKQVPDTSDIKWTKNNTIKREGLESVINPFDIGAIQLAKNAKQMLLKMDINSEINVVTMGPNQAVDALKTAIAMGCDNAYLLSDKKFAGADTLATAYTLSQFVKTYFPDFSLIICGQQAIDGDTAQTPSSMAEKLQIAQITNVYGIKDINNVYSVWFRETENYKQEIKSGYPLLVATTNANIVIRPNINSYIKAQDSVIKILSADDINADYDKIGLNGSPTQVKKAFKPMNERTTITLNSDSIDDCAEFIINEITQCRSNNE